MNPLLLTDAYKTGHHEQYPKGTTLVYANFTARSSRMSGVDHVVFFGLQHALSVMAREFELYFFNQPKHLVINEYRTFVEKLLNKKIDVTHLEALHDFGFLPIRVKALAEGSIVPIGVPLFTICNTHPDFYWLPNYLETLLSCSVWQSITSATIAHEYRKVLEGYARLTGCDNVDYQAHDFSMRGQTSVESAAMSGAGHLTSFKGSDTLPAIQLLKNSYGGDVCSVIGSSVPATEHAVMCMGGMESEQATIEQLITEVYPSGIVSVVSDTWDFWKVLTETLPRLKDKIMARNGKLVIRPDSGDPVKILCGDPSAALDCPSLLGAVEILWNAFGGTVNALGFRVLDPHIGLIYGDSITLERADLICKLLMQKGFASTNVIFGIGSYTYQYVTRDTFGFAMKSTYGEISGEPKVIFKDPKTDDGIKRSRKGLLAVHSGYEVREKCTWEEEREGLLTTVYENGAMHHRTTLETVREWLSVQREHARLSLSSI